jgi:hypothetical protein
MRKAAEHPCAKDTHRKKYCLGHLALEPRQNGMQEH